MAFLQSSVTTGTYYGLAFDGANGILGSYTANTGIWYSSNSGETWTQSDLTTSGYFTAVLEGDVGLICALTGQGILYSDDAGATWSQSDLTSGSGRFRGLVVSGSNAIAGSTGNGGIYYSSDGGETWTQSNITTDAYWSIVMDGDNAVAASGNSKGILYSTNAGETWTQSNITTQSYQPNALSINGSTVLVGSNTNDGLWYSTDTGQTWTQSDVDTNDWFSTAISGTNAIAGASNSIGIKYSSDSGVTWSNSDITTGNFASVKLNGAVGLAISNSNDGVYYSVDSGATWTQTNITSGTGHTVSFTTGTRAAVTMSTNTGAYYTDSPVCYHDEVSIMCVVTSEEGEVSTKYICLKDVNAGDVVRTYGEGDIRIKFLHRFPYCVMDDSTPINCLYKRIDSEMIVTGGHSILVDELSDAAVAGQKTLGFDQSIGDKKLQLACFDPRFERLYTRKVISMCHVVLEHDNQPGRHYGVYVDNGLISETCSEGARKQQSFK
jgi:hypothetical protein